MTKLLHISDIHFGKLNADALLALHQSIKTINPSLLVVSGDFTQRAKHEQFIAAREFLFGLSCPYFVIAGNHDLPLWRIWERVFAPLKKYYSYISSEKEPVLINEKDGFAILSVHTPRRYVPAEGRVSNRQVRILKKKLARVPEGVLKIVVTHHPIALMHTLAARKFEALGFDLLLSGHDHRRGVNITLMGNHSFLDIRAGTVTGRHLKNNHNSFNMIELLGPQIKISGFDFNPEKKQFELVSTNVFVKDLNNQFYEKSGSNGQG